MSGELGVEMPITEQVYNILYKNLPAKEAVHNLMTREITAERFE
jgi:glycerol-3-phosphate dehydrogenase (NAD(P)+)